MGLFNRNKKKDKNSEKEIVRLVEHNGGCLATNRITVDGREVGYMYREVTDRDGDTGWRFFSGDEDESYMANNSNHGVYEVNTIANYSPEILEYLNTPAPCAFEKIEGSRKFRKIEEE